MFLQLFILVLACDSVGFISFNYFVGVGYGLSVAAQALFLLFVYRAPLSVQLVANILWGLRLSWFLYTRKYSGTGSGKSPPFSQSLTMWPFFALLYVMLSWPLVVTAVSRSSSLLSSTLSILSVIGFGIETVGDAQKQRVKASHPNEPVMVGIYRYLRFPNYTGELLFWYAGAASYLASGAPLGWFNLAMTGLGLAGISAVLLGAIVRLKKSQNEKYKQIDAFRVYAGL